jgi:hypothetical protein
MTHQAYYLNTRMADKEYVGVDSKLVFQRHMLPWLTMSNVLLILGMHRSGTSLLANYLARGGLHVGTDLLGMDWSNPAGHFENRAFLKFHNDVLKAHNLDFKVSAPVDWKLTSEHDNAARQLVRIHGSKIPWGWKDPRTCLFLDFWRKVDRSETPRNIQTLPTSH